MVLVAQEIMSDMRAVANLTSFPKQRLRRITVMYHLANQINDIPFVLEYHRQLSYKINYWNNMHERGLAL